MPRLGRVDVVPEQVLVLHGREQGAKRTGTGISGRGPGPARFVDVGEPVGLGIVYDLGEDVEGVDRIDGEPRVIGGKIGLNKTVERVGERGCGGFGGGTIRHDRRRKPKIRHVQQHELPCATAFECARFCRNRVGGAHEVGLDLGWRQAGIPENLEKVVGADREGIERARRRAALGQELPDLVRERRHRRGWVERAGVTRRRLAPGIVVSALDARRHRTESDLLRQVLDPDRPVAEPAVRVGRGRQANRIKKVARVRQTVAERVDRAVERGRGRLDRERGQQGGCGDERATNHIRIPLAHLPSALPADVSDCPSAQV